MFRLSLLALLAVASACTTGTGAAGNAAPDAATDVAVDAIADAGSDDANATDGSKADATPDTAQDAGPSETAAEVATDAAVDVASDAGPPDVAADIAKEVADVAVADTTVADSAPDAPADTKPEVAQPKDGQCTVEVGCKNAMMCIAPGESIGCGICFKVETACDSDASCNPPDTLCKPLKCACGGESTCQPGCKVAADCAEGFFCAPTGKCVEDVCKITDPPGADPSCKPNFVCKNPANPHCFRKDCKASSECDGYCVKGLCYAAPGQCSYPPP